MNNQKKSSDLTLNLRRVRSSVRTALNSGGRGMQSGSCGYTVCVTSGIDDPTGTLPVPAE